MPIESILKQHSTQFNLRLTPTQLELFTRYSHELIAWNQKINLTRITEPTEIAIKHFLDSLSLYPALASTPLPFSLIDVGSGPGFPGLPLKIIQPEIKLTLLESTHKKTDFLHHLVQTLSLKEISILTARAEEIGQDSTYRAQFDTAVARAVASVSVLAEYMLPLLKIGGQMIIQKGQYPKEEIEAASQALTILGGEIEQILPITVPKLKNDRHLIIIRKKSSSPEKYPRRPGLPTKRPL